MKNHDQLVLHSLHQQFDDFLTETPLSDRLHAVAQAWFADFLAWKQAEDNWDARGVRTFFQQKPQSDTLDLSDQESKQVLRSLQQFVQQHPFNQAKILLHSYLLALKKNGCSNSTIRNYRSDINQFIDFHAADNLSSLLTKPKLGSFERYQAKKGLKDSSITRKTVSISQFSEWAAKSGALTTDQLAEASPQISTNPPATAEAASTVVVPTATSVIEPIEPKPLSEPESRSAQTPTTFETKIVPAATAKIPVKPSPLPTPPKAVSKQAAVAEVTSKTRHSFLSYVNFGLILLFCLGMSWLGYTQFYQQVDQPLAFPTEPTRPNRTLSFQGRLTDTAQNPITTATDARFYIYDSGPSIVGGTQLWDSGTCSIDPDQDGIFSTQLGSDCGTEIGESVFSENADTWLEVEIETETLSPRQPIAAVAYALNSETLQGYPINASESATTDTVLVMNSSGEVVLGEDSPTLRSDTGTFFVEGQSVQIQTSSGGNGDITLSPDGLGEVIAESYLYAPGATLSATYAGATVFTVEGGPSGTGDLTQWLANGGSVLSVVDASGNLGIGTSNPAAAIESRAASEQLRLSYDGSNSSSFTVGSSGDLTINPTGNDTTIDGDIIIGSSGSTTFNTVEYTWPGGDGSSGYILSTNGSGSLSWTDPGSLTASTTYWDLTDGTLYPINTTLDLLVGGTTTASAGVRLGRDGSSNFDTDTLIVDAPNDRVGIGTTTPDSRLHILGINAQTGGLTFESSVGTADRLALYPTGNDSFNIKKLSASSTLNFLDSSDNAEVVIDSAGYVGIGTTNPLTTLQVVSGTPNFDNSWKGTGYEGVGFLGQDSGFALVSSDSGTIGSSISLGQMDELNPTNTKFENQWALWRETNGDGSGNGNFYIGYGTDNRPWQSTELFTIDTTGNVGIGTTTPDALLEIGNGTLTSIDGTNDLLVQDDIEVDDDLFVGDDATIGGNNLNINSLTYAWPASHGSANYVLANNGSGTLSWTDVDTLVTPSSSSSWTLNSGDGTLYPINETLDLLVGGTTTASAGIRLAENGDAYFSGDVGIGTDNPNATLDIRGDAIFNELGADNDFRIEGDTEANLFFVNAGNDQVGIGDSDPDARLDITSTAAQLRLAHNTTDTAYSSFQTGSNGNLTIDVSGNSLILANGDALNIGGLTNVDYNALSDVGTTSNGLASDDDLYIEGDLEVDGTVYFDSGSTTINGVGYTWPGSAAAANDYVLTSTTGGVLSWTDVDTLVTPATTNWTLNSTDGTIYPVNETLDLLVGGTSTNSAKFAVLNVDDNASGTPTASVSAGTAGAAYLTASGELQTTNNQDLTLGGSTTNQISISDDLIPTTDDTYNLGSSTNRFQDLYLGPATLSIGTDGNDYQMSFDTTGVGTLVLNEAGDDTDFRVEGDTVANLLTVDASTNRIGIGTNAPTARLDVRGGVVFNEDAGNVDFRVEGQTNANLFMADASSDSIGIGTNTPTATLDVRGSAVFNEAAADVDFRVEGTSNANLLFGDASTNRVGIGTSTPSYTLDVNGDAQIQGGNLRINGLEQSALAFTGLTDWYLGTVSSTNPLINVDSNDYFTYNRASNYYSFLTGGSERFRIENDGDFIGQRFIDTSSASYFVDPAATGTAISIDGDIVSNGTFTISSNGNNNIDIDAGSGTVSIGGGTGKFDAGTVDPPYFVNGVSYATFLSGMIGVREEFAETVTLQPSGTPGLFKHEISFDTLPEGTELWLFSRIVDIDPEMNNLVVLVNAQDGSKVSYKKDLLNRKLIFFGSKPTEISYRLTAPRFDHEEWDVVRPIQDGTGFQPGEYQAGNAPAGAQGVTDASLLAELETSTDLTLDELGNIQLTGTNSSTATAVRDGSTLSSLAAYANVVAANIRAGITRTGRLIAEFRVQSPRVETDLLSPLADDDLIIELADSSEAAAGTAGQLAITNQAGDQVASISGDGDAAFAGDAQVDQDLTVGGTTRLGSLLADDLTTTNASVAGTTTTNQLDASSARIEALEAGMAQLEAVEALTANLTNATVSGTLYAANIDGFTDQVGAALQEPSLLQKLMDEQDENPAEATVARLVEVIETDGFSTTGSGSLNKSLSDLALDSTDLSIGAEAAFINRYFETNGDAFIGGSLGVTDTLLIGDGLQLANGLIQQNPTEADPNPTLQLQPSGLGQISLLADTMVIHDSGQVTVTGDVSVAGSVTVEETLLTDLLQPTEFGNPFQVQVAGVATESGEVRESRFEIVDERGAAVATISAEGRADFAGGIGVASQDLSDSSDSEVTANKTSGKATIAEATDQIVIKSELISENTLIYITPIGSTGNQVLYIKSQTAEDPETSDKEGQFTVGFDNPADSDVQFNWWLVN